MTAYTISPLGLALIQDGEGFHAEPRQLPSGGWLVGYGHVRAEPGAPVSQAEAVNLLCADLAPVERIINEKVSQSLLQSQFDALVSFAFSVGVAAFDQSQVLRRVNAGDFLGAACAMDAWRKSDVSGELEVVGALVLRRAAEKALFLKDVLHEATPSAFVRAKLDHAASILGAPRKYAVAPAIGSVPVVSPQIAPLTQLAEILKSESATELLLTQVVPNDADDNGEIFTAHAKPVARKIEIADELPIDRRIRNSRTSPSTKSLTLPAFRLPSTGPSFENFGLIALLLFGLALVGVGGSMLFEDRNDVIALTSASALAAPGIAAVLMAAFGLLRMPRAKARAA